jgi:hypothetical protein
MRRRRVIIGILALVVCGVLAVVFWPEKPEPVYKGKKLSELLLATVTNAPFANGPTFNEVVDAVGTNAFPLYLDWLQYEPGLLRKGEVYAAQKFREWLKIQWWPRDIRAAQATRAEYALMILGNKGRALIPQLGYIATHSTSVLVRERAMTCLEDMHPWALPTLLTLMTNENANIRLSAVFRARYFNSEPLFRARVIELSRDPDAAVRHAATNMLEWMNGPMKGTIQGPIREYVF